MARCGSLLCTLGVIACAALAPAPATLAAVVPLVESTLSEARKASLVVDLAVLPKKSYGQIIEQAVAAETPCEEVVAFLCADAENTPQAVKKIVFAAIVDGKCDAGKVITRALQAGAPLQAVVEAAIRAGVGRKEIAAAAAAAGYTAEQIATAFLNAFAAGGGTGGAGGGTGGPPIQPSQASPFLP